MAEAPCDLCGYSPALYELDADATSTAAMGSYLVTAAAEDLPDDALHTEHDGTTIATLVASVRSFEGDTLATAHHGLHTMAQIGVLRAALGHGPTPATGEVTGLHASGGGVPKVASESVQIDRSGVVGDVQSDRKHHGRPLQALCLWSADTIAQLNAEGHPVAAGMAGENITVSGADWPSMRPGSLIHVGTIPVLISAHATPCAKIAAGFVERNHVRVDHDEHPGWSRLYGIPLATGSVAVGDPISVG